MTWTVAPVPGRAPKATSTKAGVLSRGVRAVEQRIAHDAHTQVSVAVRLGDGGVDGGLQVAADALVGAELDADPDGTRVLAQRHRVALGEAGVVEQLLEHRAAAR